MFSRNCSCEVAGGFRLSGPSDGVQPASGCALGTGMTSMFLLVIHRMTDRQISTLVCLAHCILSFLLLHYLNNQNKISLVCGSLSYNFLGHTLVFFFFCYLHMHANAQDTHHTNTQIMQTHLHACSTLKL